MEIQKGRKVGEFSICRSNLGRFFHLEWRKHLCTVFINLHTHCPALSAGLIEIESVYFGQYRQPTSAIRSVGLHPWYLAMDLDPARRWLQENAVQAGILAIGEAGLDKLGPSPFDLQIKAFQICLEVSESTEKPLILHCVRAYSEILALKKLWKPRQAWIFHGFDKNPATADMLLHAGCYLSFGAALFRKNSHVSESLKAVPEDRFFLETDDAKIGIEEVYERAAAIRGIGLGDLEAGLELNFKRLF